MTLDEQLKFKSQYDNQAFLLTMDLVKSIFESQMDREIEAHPEVAPILISLKNKIL